MSIYGNPSGGFGYPKTFILTDPNGTELTGVVVGQETLFTANRADVKVGKIFASDEGVEEGTDTKTYRTTQGKRLIPSGNNLSITLPQYEQYDYTKLQCMIAPFNTSDTDSVAVDKVAIDSCVYNTGSTTKIADITKNTTNKSIDLNITNSTDNYLVIHFFTYKEEA